MFESTTEYIENYLIKIKKIPYIDILVNYRQKEIYRHFGGMLPSDGKERLCMFSLTKPLTSVLMLRLIEAGKVSLYDNVSKYIPAFDKAIYNYNGIKVKADIKIVHLLTMTSGLNYDLNSFALNRIKADSHNSATTFEVASALSEVPLEFEPGKRFLYGLSYDVLAAIIEVVTAEKFSEYMKKNIFEPLGMNNSTLKKCKNAPSVFIFEDKKGIFPAKYNSYYDFIITNGYESGGAGLISTVEDYSIFAETLANGGNAKSGYRLLSNESLDLMTSNYIPSVSFCNSFTCIQGEDYGYGFGVRVRTKDSEFGLPIGEFGWDGAAGSYMLIDPKNNISIVIGLNVLNWPSFFKGEHLKIVEKIYGELSL